MNLTQIVSKFDVPWVEKDNQIPENDIARHTSPRLEKHIANTLKAKSTYFGFAKKTSIKDIKGGLFQMSLINTSKKIFQTLPICTSFSGHQYIVHNKKDCELSRFPMVMCTSPMNNTYSRGVKQIHAIKNSVVQTRNHVELLCWYIW